MTLTNSYTTRTANPGIYEQSGWLKEQYYIPDGEPPHARKRQPIEREYLRFQHIKNGRRTVSDTIYRVKLGRQQVWVWLDERTGLSYTVERMGDSKDHWRTTADVSEELYLQEHP